MAGTTPEAKDGRPSDVPSADDDLDQLPGEATAPIREVDALFAKLRASNGTSDHRVDEEAATAGAPSATSPDAAIESDEPSDQPSVGEDGPPLDRPPRVVQRDELVAPVVATLSRRLKRTLQDAQNEILDQLRSNGSHWSPQVMPQETEQVDGITTAVLPVLEEASVAGATFAAGAKAASPSTDAVIAIAHGLAEEVVVPLRRRLSDDGGVAEAGEAAAAEHVGAAFREWRGSRVEQLAGDFVVAAFSLGSVTAVERDADGQLEWISVPGSGDAPCPDCEDNGLTGPQRPGEEFPTGHRHPPAHPGCRCLVAPAAP
jgi:hypothetical protein